MARYTGPKSKIARKFGEPIFGEDKALEKRNYPPGQHGNNRRRGKQSEYALQLKNLGVGTPEPIAYYEFETLLLFKKSYYISQQLECDLTYRELTKDFNYPDYDAILRAFTRFTYQLHEKGIKFLDHSPGNTLIKKVGDEYQFFLVDLNRMEFKPLSFEERIKNFRRLTIHKSMVDVMSDEYAKVSGKNYDKIVNLMWQSTQDFQNIFHKRRSLKKKLKFWKR